MGMGSNALFQIRLAPLSGADISSSCLGINLYQFIKSKEKHHDQSLL